MSEQFYTILTTIGKAKLANASALGTKLNLTTFVVGDGNGTYYNPTEIQTTLKREVWRGNISSVSVEVDNPNWIVIDTVIPGDTGGFMIRESGVLDVDGNLIAIGKYPETYKPMVADGSTKDLYTKMILEVSNAASVTLKIDPTVILATKKDINNLEDKIKTLNGAGEIKEKVNKSEFDGFKQSTDTSLGDMTNVTTTAKNAAGAITELNSNKAKQSDLTNHTNLIEKHRKITFGTADPTGGVHGDIYLQYK